MTVRATARLQFHKDFTLDDATALVPYLKRLGVSHLYASPLLTSRPGSTHGYDIVDHNAIDPELGGEAALRRLVAALRGAGLGLILDIVPNHMGVGGADNAWWLDVLEWGRASPYAQFFDIDWESPNPALRNRMLAPFLGESYGTCLAKGELELTFDPADGRIVLDYYGNRFPIDPHDYPAILRHGGLADDAAAFAALGGPREARGRAEAARAALRGRDAAAIAAALAAYNADTPDSRDRLHRLLERQSYRLSWWRAATDEINWRRFFDVNSLAGVRAELPEVFDATHDYVLSLYAEGLIDGVRIDHVDGLADPRGYCRKLRRKLQTAAERRPPDLPAEPAIVWIEKILAPHERLAADWLTDGTTGYDFMDQVAGLLHDPAGEAPLTQLWMSLTNRSGEFAVEAQAARRQILRESLSSELWATAAALHRVGQRDLATRDYTLTAIRRALEEILVHFPTYRIYAGSAGIDATDRQVLDWALAGARRTVRSADLPLIDVLGRWLDGEGLRDVPAGPQRRERLRAMVRFQQLSAPTAAKSVEDTAFYRYGRLLSRNEVGSEPSHFAVGPAAFHAANAERRRRFPRALLATATHDHKRGEDTRARLAVLSELPGEWEAALGRWMRLNAPLRRDVEALAAPDAADEVMLYQTLVGAWPLDLPPGDLAGRGAALEAFRERVWGWWEKALREAKRRSEWAAPSEPYESACREFLAQVLDTSRPAHVVEEIAAFAERIAAAGAVNGLAQATLRLTVPGVPDLYQGTEYWDFSLVDPDNRRPVDYAARRASLAAGLSPEALLPDWRDGRVKQAVIARILASRSEAPGLFAEGSYLKLRVEGPRADHIFAFARVHEGRAMLVVVPRLVAGLPLVGSQPLVMARTWHETDILVPRILAGRGIDPVLGGTMNEGGSRLSVEAVLGTLPVSVMRLR